MTTALGVPRRSPIQVLTKLNVAWLQWSDENWYFQRDMAVVKSSWPTKGYFIRAHSTNLAANYNRLRPAEFNVATYTQNSRAEKFSGGAGYRSRYLSHAKRALYHLSYAPKLLENQRSGQHKQPGSQGHTSCKLDISSTSWIPGVLRKLPWAAALLRRRARRCIQMSFSWEGMSGPLAQLVRASC